MLWLMGINNFKWRNFKWRNRYQEKLQLIISNEEIDIIKIVKSIEKNWFTIKEKNKEAGFLACYWVH